MQADDYYADVNSVHARVHRFSYDARHLRPGAAYEALVQARNKFGWSERSEAVRFAARREDEDEASGRRRGQGSRRECSICSNRVGNRSPIVYEP